MPNYPPTPSFGLPFSFGSSGPSSATRPISTNKSRQVLAKAQRKTSGPVSRTAYAQTANAFQQNQAIPSFARQAAFGGPPPDPTNGQFLNGMIPRPPYPPVQVPGGSQSGYNPSFPAESMQNLSPPHMPVQGSADVNQPIAISSSSHQRVELDREEGELSDGDIRGRSTPVGHNAAIIVPQPARSGRYTQEEVIGLGAMRDHRGQRRDPSSMKAQSEPKGDAFPESHSLTRAQMPQTYERYPMPDDTSRSSAGKSYDHTVLEYRDRETSTRSRYFSGDSKLTSRIDHHPSSYRTQNTMNEHKRSIRDRTLYSPSHQQTLQQVHETPISQSMSSRHDSPTAGKSHEEIRRLAKNAVMNLIPLKVGYNDYIEEGIDEEVVRGLFEELGQKIPAQNTSHPKETKEDPTGSIPVLPKLPSENAEVSPMLVCTEQGTNSSAATQGIQSAPGMTNSGTPLAPPSSASANKGVNLKAANAAHVALPSLGNASPVPPTSEPLHSTSDKPSPPKLTRAEIIKQRFAERENKSLQQDKLATPVPSTKATSVPEIVSDVKKDKTAEQEKISKNELIKQRMEALKKTAMFKSAEKQPTTQNGENAHLNHSEESTPLASPEQNATVAAPQPENPTNIVMPFSGIPGLFMTSSSAPKEEVPFQSDQVLSLPSQVQGATRRKRPVATDFDAIPTPTTNSFKRPFGRSRIDRPLVIDVSDDDSANADEDSDMDIDEDDQSPESDQSRKVQASKERSSFRDFPPLPDFPNKRRPGMWASAPGSTLNTPPLSKDSPFAHPNGRSKNSAQEDLKRKEEEIQLMRKKLAEKLEQSKKLKQGTSRVHTPGTPNRSAKTSGKDQAGSRSPERKEATASEIDRLIEDAQRQVDSDRLKLAEAKAAELANVQKAEAEANATDLAKAEQAREAKAATEAEEERKKLLRLAEIQSGLPLLDAEVEKSKSKLEELKAETMKWEATVKERLEGRKKLVEEMEALKIQSAMPKADTRFQAEHAETTKTTEDFPEQGFTLSVTTQKLEHDISPERLDISNQRHTTGDSGRQDDVAQTLSAPTNPIPQSAASMATREESERVSPDDSLEAMDMSEDSAQGSTTNQCQEAEPSSPPPSHLDRPKPKTIETAPCGQLSNDPITTDIADTGMGDSDVSSIVERPSNTNDGLSANDTESDQEEGEINEGSQSFDESDFYEPPDATTPINIPLLAQDIHPQDALISADQVPPNTNGHISQGTSEDVGDTHPVSTKDPIFPINESVSEMPPNSLFFTPYESPLKQFRAYRYHRNFQKDVPGGFRSLTYSHNINPEVPMCSFETSGGICNDSSCTFQHFRDVKMNDDLVLAQLGSVNVGRNEEQKVQYREGLKQIIQNMRNQKVKDFTTVASQIAAYPAKFLNDDSRVLILDSHQPAQEIHHPQR